MRRAKANLEALRGFARARWFALLAEHCAKIEGAGAGLELLSEGLALIQVTRERNYEAELSRLKGELLLMQDAPNAAEAESCFRNAIELARPPGR